jgi:hypothetical protein
MTLFLRCWTVSLLVLVALVVGLNLLIDPYEVFGTPRIRHISLLKPGAKNHAMLAKTYQIARVHPVTVLIGSSSTHVGLDADDPAWPEAVRSVYNYGVPGVYSPATSLATLRETIALGNVRNVVVALDFTNFFAPDEPLATLTEDDLRFRLLPDGNVNPYRSLQVAKDMFLSTATMGAFIDSVVTISGQRAVHLLNLTPNGSSNEADFINAARNDGMGDLFAQKKAVEVKRATNLAEVMAHWKGPLPDTGVVAAIIDLARVHGLKLTLMIAPRHADALEIYWHLGLWPRVEQLKVELATLAGERADTVTLWDFMDYSSFNTETVPAASERRAQTQWFWESTHFKRQLGTIMIENMFGQDVRQFGVRLTPGNVVARNAEVRAQRQAMMCNRTDSQC